MSMSAFQLSTSHLLGVELFGSQIISVIIYGVIIIVGLASPPFSRFYRKVGPEESLVINRYGGTEGCHRYRNHRDSDSAPG